MKLLTIILKSGIKIDLKDAEKVDILTREEVSLSYRGLQIRDETEWTASPNKKILTFLRITKENTFWEVREDEIAAFEYSKKETEGEIINKGEIKI